MLGCYNAQGLGKDYELLLRITNGKKGINDGLMIIVCHEPVFETTLKVSILTRFEQLHKNSKKSKFYKNQLKVDTQHKSMYICTRKIL